MLNCTEVRGMSDSHNLKCVWCIRSPFSITPSVSVCVCVRMQVVNHLERALLQLQFRLPQRGKWPHVIKQKHTHTHTCYSEHKHSNCQFMICINIFWERNTINCFQPHVQLKCLGTSWTSWNTFDSRGFPSSQLAGILIKQLGPDRASGLDADFLGPWTHRLLE